MAVPTGGKAKNLQRYYTPERRFLQVDNKTKLAKNQRVRMIGINNAAHTKAQVSPAALRIGGRPREHRWTEERLRERLAARRAAQR